jgi:ribosomal RNA-processing protein 12
LSKREKEEILDTVVMFLESKNREIVRSVLGFVKVVVVLLDKDILESRMEGIMKGCMVWSKENKGRLRQKVRGIIDRALRRWDGTVIESWVGTDDRKMVVNIRKRKERSKRKKNAAEADDEEDETTKAEYDNELDEQLYNSSSSDSEIIGDDDDDTMSGISFKPSKRKSKQKGKGEQYIREDSDDEPLDLLDPSSLSNISNRKLGRLRDQAHSNRRKARLNEDSKLVFGDNDKDDLMDNPEDGGGAVDSYLTAVAGPDAVRKGAKGKLKVKSSQKRGNEGDEMEIDEDDARAVSKHVHRRAGSGGSSGSFGGRGGGGRGGGWGGAGQRGGRGGSGSGSDTRNNRRGLGVEKQRGPSQGGQKFRGGGGVGKRGRGNVRFQGRRGGRR